MSTESQRHLFALSSAFAFASSSDASWREGAGKCYDGQFALIRDYIATGIPCGTQPSDLLALFMDKEWAATQAPIAPLWQAYADGGYIDPARLVEARVGKGPLAKHGSFGMVSMLPLEMAIVRQHEAAFAALVQSGARAEAVPSRPWKAGRKPTGIFSFIKLVISNDAKQARFRALAAAALGASPLEQAAFSGELATFEQLLDAGADINTLPSRQWELSKKKTDILGFIDYAVHGEQRRAEFGAVAARALMTARILSEVRKPSAVAMPSKMSCADTPAHVVMPANPRHRRQGL